MKKISLKNLNLKEVESLSREQLKNVLGGFAAGTTVVDDCKDLCGGVHGSCKGQNQGCLTYTCETNPLITYKACGYNGNGTIS